MNRKTLLLLSISTVLLVPNIGVCADAISPATLSKLKHATVLIKVNAGSDGSFGSGFVIQSDGDSALIVTNEHVVRVGRAAKVRMVVVLDAGTSKERELLATIVARDAAHDLAVLRVQGKRLPAAIAHGATPKLTETLPLVVLGFPFGTDLAAGKRNPAITVSKASISSLRRDARNRLSVIQLDGNLNPGNSGGPVVDVKGRLVGVAVARIESAGIGFAIPANTLAAMLAGDLSELLVENDRDAKLRVVCNMMDPYKKIRSVAIRVSSGPAGSGAKTYTLTRSGQSASTSIPVPSKSGASTVSIQVEFTRSNGTRIKKPTVTLRLNAGSLSGGKFVKSFSDTSVAGSITSVLRTKDTPKTAAAAVRFEGNVDYVAPAPDGSGVFFIRKKDGVGRLFFWDLASNKVQAEIRVPRSPVHIRIVGGQLLAACPESSVVAVIDPKTRKIVNAIEVSLEGGLTPMRLFATSGSELIYALCTPAGEKPRYKTAIVEIDLKDDKVKKLTGGRGRSQHAAVTATHLATQGNFGGSPSGTPTIQTLASLRKGERDPNAVRFPHASVGPIYPAANGYFVATGSSDKTSAFSHDNKDTLWTLNGTLISNWPDGSAFLLSTGEKLTNTKQWPITAVDQSGAIMWKHRVPLGGPINLWITQAIQFNNSPDFLIIGTARQGSAIASALRLVKWGVSRTYVISGKDTDHILFRVSGYSGEIYGRSALKVKEEVSRWFFAKLPQRTIRPVLPTVVGVGEKVDFDPGLSPTKSLYVLKRGPDGMTVDARTGRVRWTTDITHLGRYDVEIVKREAGKDTTVLKFGIRVTKKKTL